MKTSLGALGAILVAGAIYAHPALAQYAPRGSYLDSCRHVFMEGDRLVADCRRADGRWDRTALDIDRCVGDIGNRNDHLTRNRDNRDNREGYGSSDRRGWGDGYGSSRPDEWRWEHR